MIELKEDVSPELLNVPICFKPPLTLSLSTIDSSGFPCCSMSGKLIAISDYLFLCYY